MFGLYDFSTLKSRNDPELDAATLLAFEVA